ncbi:murein transglycosylase A [Hydrogenophaga crocea]|uniref:peptidoglycan lytic exotransglycosylase n=1 Tax=Hydrogenophaga crocea TaxID=2716225 RepID=A0A6G8IKE4_9BURK|nr:MltA domain-containing protein [Hydrogenophaga crocea]QIM53677.1 transglycosylase [Hydrogenophaga crocea]
MVHHTMNTRSTSAPSASSKSNVMGSDAMGRALRWFAVAGIVGSLFACASRPLPAPPPAPRVNEGVSAPAPGPAPAVQQRARSRWVAVDWRDLPGWGQDALHEAWNALLRGCEKPAPGFEAVCAEARPLSIAGSAEQQAWLQRRLQPYRVTEADGRAPEGLLTGYYEPILDASRLPTATQRVPLYAPPAGLPAATSGQRWYSRQEIDTLPEAQAALRGRAIAWLADPIDALVLQIQGSGRVNITEPDGRVVPVRLAFAGHNGHPYQSVGRWLLDQGAIREGSWDGIRAWARQNPQRLNEMLWSNPRTVFFREDPLNEFDARFGPRGAQNVPLTPGRSIAVDPLSIPYGTPVWLATQGPALTTQRLVLAQDTGGAIVGAVRADLFTGWGGWNDETYRLAATLKQPLQLWVLWPR